MGRGVRGGGLQQFVCQVGQFRTFSFFQPHMSIQRMFLDPVDQGGKSVTLRIKIGCIDLENIPGKNDLGIFAGPGNDGLDFVGRKVLGFIHNKSYIGDAAAADISQRGDYQFFIFDGIGDHLVFLVPFAVLVLDEFQVIPQRFHVWIEL